MLVSSKHNSPRMLFSQKYSDSLTPYPFQAGNQILWQPTQPRSPPHLSRRRRRQFQRLRDSDRLFFRWLPIAAGADDGVGGSQARPGTGHHCTSLNSHGYTHAHSLARWHRLGLGLAHISHHNTTQHSVDVNRGGGWGESRPFVKTGFALSSFVFVYAMDYTHNHVAAQCCGLCNPITG